MMDDFFNQSENSMPRIGDYAPAFRTVTTQGTIYFPADYFGKWVILFSYPSTSTPLHTSEFLALANMHNDFKALDCELLGLSVGQYSNHTPRMHIVREEIECNGTKDVEIKFPLIEDITAEVARKYGIIQPDKRNSKAVRSVFFIDPECLIKGVIYYPMSLDLNFDELKRVIVALQKEDESISPPAKSNDIAKELLGTQKEGKEYNEWCFCTRELSQEKAMNLN